MTPFAWVLGLVLPACGAAGADGLPMPPLMDMKAIERPASPNTFLAGPSDMTPAPDLVTAPRSLPADALYQTARHVLGRWPNSFIAAEYPEEHQMHFVVRSALLNFPDLVTVQVDPLGDHASTLTIWSRSVYGRGDLGVNKARVETWIAALEDMRSAAAASSDPSAASLPSNTSAP